jgi:hypothetical protein
MTKCHIRRFLTLKFVEMVGTYQKFFFVEMVGLVGWSVILLYLTVEK